MTDIVERLRSVRTSGNFELVNAAIAEIERLRAALQPFAYEYDILMQQQDGFPAWHSVRTKHLLEARRALEPKP